MTGLACFQTCLLAAFMIHGASASSSSGEIAPHECQQSDSESLLHDVIHAGEVLLQTGIKLQIERPQAIVNHSHDSAYEAGQPLRGTPPERAQNKSDLAMLETTSSDRAQGKAMFASANLTGALYLTLGFAGFSVFVAAFAGCMQLLGKPADRTPAGVGEQPPPAWHIYSSIFALVSVAVFKTQITAMLFSSSNYPTAFSLLSCVATCVLLMPCFVLFPSQWQVVNLKMLCPDLLIVVAFTACDLGFANIALAELSTALTQIIAACNPAITACIETGYLGKMQHYAVYVAVLGLVLGAAFATTGSTGIDRFSTYGLIAAMIQVSCSACKYVFAHGILKKHKGALSSLSLLFWLDFLMIPIYIPWVSANGEFTGLFITETHSSGEWFTMIATSAIGGVRAFTQFVVLSYVSATSMSAANIFTQILNILISLPIQHTPLTLNLVIGICFTLSASGCYYVLKNFPGAIRSIDETCPMCAGDRKAAEAAGKS